MSNEFNFIHKDRTDDKDLFFGPLSGNENFIEIDETWSMAKILVHAGIFPSISQARKNGASVEPLEQGFQMFTRGKNAKRKEFFILNMFDS